MISSYQHTQFCEQNGIRHIVCQSKELEAGLCKEEIRELYRRPGLPTWNKQSFACLSSRFVYGETINEEKPGVVDKAEQRLWDFIRSVSASTQLTLETDGILAYINQNSGLAPKTGGGYRLRNLLSVLSLRKF